MSQKITLKRSNVGGKIPSDSALDLGELAINTYDGKLYLKKDVNGTETVVDVTHNDYTQLENVPSAFTPKTEETQDIVGGMFTSNVEDGMRGVYVDSTGKISLYNDDKGSSQKIFKTISVSGQADITADTNSDTLTFAAGSNVTLTTDPVAGTMVINSSYTDTNTDTTYTAGTGVDLNGTTFSHSDSSSIADTNNAGAVVLQNLVFDEMGHVQSTSDVNLDGLYERKGVSQLNYVAKSGDTMSGSLAVDLSNQTFIAGAGYESALKIPRLSRDGMSIDAVGSDDEVGIRVVYDVVEAIMTPSQSGAGFRMATGGKTNFSGLFQSSSNHHYLHLRNPGDNSDIVHQLSTDPLFGVVLGTNVQIDGNLDVSDYFVDADALKVKGINIDDIYTKKSTTISTGSGLTGGGTLGSNILISHANTSSMTSVNNSGNTVIQDLTVDEFGHLTAAASKTLTLAGLGYTGDPVADKYTSWDLQVNNGTTTPIGSGTNVNFIEGANVDITRSGSDITVSSSYVDTVYTHPAHPGDDISVDTGPLTGASVISRVNFNVTSDTQGHVTDANGTYTTRNLTPADIGAAPAHTHPYDNYGKWNVSVDSGIAEDITSNENLNFVAGENIVMEHSGSEITINATAEPYAHPTYSGDDISVDTGPLTGAWVISDLDFNVTTDGTGHVSDANGTFATRQLTRGDIGAGTMSNFTIKDDDDDDLVISNGKEIKFLGNGIGTNWTKTTDGTDASPYELTFTNTDKGSSQNIFKRVMTTTGKTASGTTITADNNNDILYFQGSGATTISVDDDQDTIIIHSTDTNTNTTYTAGAGIDLNGTVFSHTDTSSQTSVDNSGATVIQDVTLDTYGHITGLASKTLTRGDIGAGTMSGFTIKDDDDDDLYIGNGKEIKFLGNGIGINWTDTSDGSDTDPYDLTLTNTDKGSTQAIWKTFTADSGTITADSNADSFDIEGGTGITTAISGDKVTITNSSPNANQNVVAGAGMTGGGSGSTTTLNVIGKANGGITVAANDISVDSTVARLDATAEQTFAGSITINQDLTVLGNTNVTQRDISTGENALILNADWADAEVPTQDAGVYVYRGTGTGSQNTVGLVWDEANDEWIAETRSGVDPGNGTVDDILGTRVSAHTIWTESNFTPSNKANTSTTISAGSGLTGGGSLGANRTISHADTSSAASVNNSSGMVIQDLTFDTFGHVTGHASTNLDNRYISSFQVEDGAGTEVTINQGKELKFVQGSGMTVTFTDTSTGSDADPFDLTFTNTDRGSSQSIFKNVATTTGRTANGSTIVADSNNDTLNFQAGGATTITTDSTTDTIIISSTDTNTVYTHPSYAGDDISVDTGPLTGAWVISDLDFNVTTDGTGHVSDANGTFATRQLTRGDIGAGTMSNFYVEDGDGTEVNITQGKEWKFVEAAGSGATININWSDTTTGSDADPYDLSFSVTNTDKGSAQNIFKNIATTTGKVANAATIVADSNNDTLNFQAGGATTITTDSTTDTIIISSTDTNTDTVYTHPTYAGDDINIDTAPLTGAWVISDLDFNVTTNTGGHVTDANGSVATRQLTPGDIGAAPAHTHPYDNYGQWKIAASGTSGTSDITTGNTVTFTGAGATSVTRSGDNITISSSATQYTHPTYTARSINTTGAQVLDILTTNTSGHVTAASTRTMTLADLGYTGPTNADRYNGWDLQVNTGTANRITTGENVNFVEGGGIDIGLTGATVTVSHQDTSGASTVNNSGGTVIQDLTFDTYGHVTARGSVNLDTRYAMINTTSPTAGYLYVRRSSTSSAMYVNNYSTGPIASFFKGASSTATSGTSQVTIQNNADIDTTGNVSATKEVTSGAGVVNLTTSASVEFNSTENSIDFIIS